MHDQRRAGDVEQGFARQAFRRHPGRYDNNGFGHVAERIPSAR
jgi:hypothetical protein